VEIFYKATHNACRCDVNGRVPRPRIIQEFVTAWKALRMRTDSYKTSWMQFQILLVLTMEVMTITATMMIMEATTKTND
jgi:hypothetical protein